MRVLGEVGLRTVLIVTGPTGVGKTNFVDRLSKEYPIEIINGDMGDFLG